MDCFVRQCHGHADQSRGARCLARAALDLAAVTTLHLRIKEKVFHEVLGCGDEAVVRDPRRRRAQHRPTPTRGSPSTARALAEHYAAVGKRSASHGDEYAHERMLRDLAIETPRPQVAR
jgi:hypothetical protein